jgi:hypothetical protein
MRRRLRSSLGGTHATATHCKVLTACAHDPNSSPCRRTHRPTLAYLAEAFWGHRRHSPVTSGYQPVRQVPHRGDRGSYPSLHHMTRAKGAPQEAATIAPQHTLSRASCGRNGGRGLRQRARAVHGQALTRTAPCPGQRSSRCTAHGRGRHTGPQRWLWGPGPSGPPWESAASPPDLAPRFTTAGCVCVGGGGEEGASRQRQTRAELANQPPPAPTGMMQAAAAGARPSPYCIGNRIRDTYPGQAVVCVRGLGGHAQGTPQNGISGPQQRC